MVKAGTPSKGEATRRAILDRAFELARTMGLEGLTIGRLASELDLSKSGLHAHFGSKDKLEVELVQAAAERFAEAVVRPALREKRGEPRLRALLERWIAWGEQPGGCFFIAAQADLDDRPGPARDALVQAQRDWLDTLAHAIRIAVAEGHLRRNLDVEQLAFELYCLGFGYSNLRRLLPDPKRRRRLVQAFDRLLDGAR